MLAAIGVLDVGMGMGLVMGMGWDEGGVFVSCRDFPGMSFSCGTQLSTECEREGHVPCGHLHLGWGLCLL